MTNASPHPFQQYRDVDKIFMSIENNDVASLVIILKSGVDVNQVNDLSLSRRPLHAAVIAVGRGGPPELIKLLIEYGADINLTCPGIGGGTPLQVAVYNEFIGVVSQLIDLGADPNIQGEEGDGPLRASISTENIEIAKLLLTKGARETIDVYGGLEGSTALGMAVSRLNICLVKMLIDAGARADIVDLDYNTALDCLPASSVTNAITRETVRKLLI